MFKCEQVTITSHESTIFGSNPYWKLVKVAEFVEELFSFFLNIDGGFVLLMEMNMFSSELKKHLVF